MPSLSPPTPDRPVNSWLHSRPGRAARLALATCLAAVVLAACGPRVEDEGDRRFADQSIRPAATGTATVATTVVPATPGTTAVAVAATPDPGQLLSTRSEASSAFFLAADRLLVASDDGSVRAVALPGTPLVLSVAPDGASAAVLIDTGLRDATPVATPGATGDAALPAVSVAADDAMVVVVGADGVPTREVPLADEVATVAGGAGVAAVSLGAGPDDLLLAFSDGLLVRVAADDTTTEIPGSGNLADVEWVALSPSGERVAIVASEEPGEPAALFYSPLRVDGIDLVRLGPSPGRAIGGAAWLEDSSALLFTDAGGPLTAEALRSGRDLFVTALRTDRRDLVAAAGIIGPAAGVDLFAAGPDGVFAYTLVRAEGSAVVFNSLWVGTLGAVSEIEIDLPPSTVVEGLAWTRAGLLVVTAPAEGGDPVVMLVGSDGTVQPLGGVQATPAVATG